MDNSEIIERIRKIVSDKLNVPAERITPQCSLRNDLGMDSFGSVEIMFEIEDAFNVSIPQDDAAKIETFGDMIAFVDKLTREGVGPSAGKKT
jgi:acyl carrier protein